jgi:hypothetical protein
MLRDPQQPLLMLSDVEGLRELGTARPKGRRTKKRAAGISTKATKTPKHKAE